MCPSLSPCRLKSIKCCRVGLPGNSHKSRLCQESARRGSQSGSHPIAQVHNHYSCHCHESSRRVSQSRTHPIAQQAQDQAPAEKFTPSCRILYGYLQPPRSLCSNLLTFKCQTNLKQIQLKHYMNKFTSTALLQTSRVAETKEHAPINRQHTNLGTCP